VVHFRSELAELPDSLTVAGFEASCMVRAVILISPELHELL
jgi:hypothetical protein